MLQPVGRHVWQGVAHVSAGGQGDPSGASVALVVVRDGPRTWLLGSGPTPAFGAALACAVWRDTGHVVTDVINTRAQAELALGNAAFPRARLWALAGVARAMRRQCPQCLARMKARLGAVGDSLQPTAIRVPPFRVDRVDRVDHVDHLHRMDHLGRAGAPTGRLGPFRWWALQRAPGSPVLVLQHRADRIVIAQGLLWPGAVPDLRDTTLADMRNSLVHLQALAMDHRLVGDVGAADPLGSPADVASHLAYLDALQRAVSQALQRGDVEAHAPAAQALPDFASLAWYDERHPLNVQRAWRELEAAVFR